MRWGGEWRGGGRKGGCNVPASRPARRAGGGERAGQPPLTPSRARARACSPATTSNPGEQRGGGHVRLTATAPALREGAAARRMRSGSGTARHPCRAQKPAGSQGRTPPCRLCRAAGGCPRPGPAGHRGFTLTCYGLSQLRVHLEHLPVE